MFDHEVLSNFDFSISIEQLGSAVCVFFFCQIIAIFASKIAYLPSYSGLLS